MNLHRLGLGAVLEKELAILSKTLLWILVSFGRHFGAPYLKTARRETDRSRDALSLFLAIVQNEASIYFLLGYSYGFATQLLFLTHSTYIC